ncbi:LysE family transporter, partial [Actinomadura adrarensis]
AMPVGAIATYLVALTARTTLRIGVFAALGVATADGLYALVAVAAGSAITPLLQPLLSPMRWVSALVLVGLGVRGAVQAIRQHRSEPAKGDEDADTQRNDTPVSPMRAYLALLGLTILNPVTVIYFAALVLGNQSVSGPEGVIFVLAAFAASASWQLLLAGGGALLGRALTG